MFQPQKSQSKISFWTLAFIGILVGLGLFGLWYFHVEPIYGLTTGFITPIVEGARGIGQTFIPPVIDYITKNPLAVLTATVTIGGVIGGKLLQSHYEKQKAQLQSQAEQVMTDNMSMAKSYTDLQAKYSSLQEQVKSTVTTDYQGLLNEAQTIISQKTSEIQNLQSQMKALQDMLMLKDTKIIEKTVVK